MNYEKYLNKNDYDFYSIDLGKIPPFTSSKIIEKKNICKSRKISSLFF